MTDEMVNEMLANEMADENVDPDEAAASAPSGEVEWIVALDEEAAVDVELCGGKAAALARARAAGVDTLDGVVLTTAWSDFADRHGRLPATSSAFAAARSLGSTLIVRSSSVAEDTGESSAAGQFETVANVTSENDFADAVRTVLDSRRRAGRADQPIAVLVQPMIEPDLAGVLFGIDPVTGRTDHAVVAATVEDPDELVSGTTAGSRLVVHRSGGDRAGATPGFDVIEHDVSRPAERVPRRVVAELLRLESRLSEVAGSPQDVEWALVGDRVVVLQSRPVTTERRGVPSGPVFGTGPVAETFPDPLSTLEADLWAEPLRAGLADALRLAGTRSSRDIEASPLLVVVDGRVAIDLEITGEYVPPGGPGWTRLIDPRPRVRRLRSAWRTGRLRGALPTLADSLADRVDHDLESVPPLAELGTRQLVALLARCRSGLRSLHAHEILMGLLVERADTTFTSASMALRVLAESRVDGLDDDEILRRSPLVLALVPPRIGSAAPLPDVSETPFLEPVPDLPAMQVRREALRLRVRWLQELSGRAAWELGDRLFVADRLPTRSDVRHLDLATLSALAERRASVVAHLLERRRNEAPDGADGGGASVPTRFRLGDRGRPIPLRTTSGDSGSGTGAGGGVGRGVAVHDPHDLGRVGDVLIVGDLRPDLGPELDRMAALVAESGNVLSHLAILARERGVATVVGHTDARRRVPVGATVLVDGDDGRVELLEVGDDAGGGAGGSDGGDA